MNFRLEELIVDSCTIMITFILSCLVISVISHPIKIDNEGCYLDVKEDFTAKHPLLLKDNINQFILPQNKAEIILYKGETVRISCPGKNNNIKLLNQKEATITCVKDQKFAINGYRYYSFKDLYCESFPDSFSQPTGRNCGTGFTELEIGFNTEKGFVNLITSCFDELHKNTMYVSHNLTKMIKYQQHAKRPSSFKPDFYENINPQNLYTRTSQLKRFADILDDENLAKKYIKLGSEYFLARGHLAPKADFIYASQQRATFFYINVAPQWQTFNGKNWNKLEQNCRYFAMKNQLDLTVYTGVYGIAKLADINNNLNDLSLSRDNTLTVPAIFWKIIYDSKSKRGTVFVGHNNPYEKEIEPICTDVSNRIKWLQWKPNNVVSGYAYCCEYDEFKKVVKYAPDIEINGVLI